MKVSGSGGLSRDGGYFIYILFEIQPVKWYDYSHITM